MDPKFRQTQGTPPTAKPAGHSSAGAARRPGQPRDSGGTPLCEPASPDGHSASAEVYSVTEALIIKYLARATRAISTLNKHADERFAEIAGKVDSLRPSPRHRILEILQNPLSLFALNLALSAALFIVLVSSWFAIGFARRELTRLIDDSEEQLAKVTDPQNGFAAKLKQLDVILERGAKVSTAAEKLETSAEKLSDTEKRFAKLDFGANFTSSVSKQAKEFIEGVAQIQKDQSETLKKTEIERQRLMDDTRRREVVADEP